MVTRPLILSKIATPNEGESNSLTYYWSFSLCWLGIISYLIMRQKILATFLNATLTNFHSPLLEGTLLDVHTKSTIYYWRSTIACLWLVVSYCMPISMGMQSFSILQFYMHDAAKLFVKNLWGYHLHTTNITIHGLFPCGRVNVRLNVLQQCWMEMSTG